MAGRPYLRVRCTAVEFNLAEVNNAVAAAIPDREAIVWRDRRITYAEFAERTNRLANHLIAAGLGAHTPRAALAGHESGQDHLAVFLYNGNEYLEAMLGAYKARVAPFNVNYRYVAEELEYLLRNSAARALVYSAMTDAGLRFTWHELNGQHAFMRDEGPCYDPELALTCYGLTLELFKRTLDEGDLPAS